MNRSAVMHSRISRISGQVGSDPNIGQICPVHAGEHRHAQYRRPGDPEQAAIADRMRPRPHHLRSAEGVNVENRNPETRGGLNRAGNRVRDVVKLEIEENALARLYDFADKLRAFRGEQLASDLEHPNRAAQRLDQPKGAVAIRDVKGDYQPVLDPRRGWVGDHCHSRLIRNHSARRSGIRFRGHPFGI
jgi:hypothetical protein